MSASSPPRIAILGAGPIGLEAALAAAEAGYPFTVYERGAGAADHVRSWGHVRLFSPWDLDVSPRARRALAAAGREVPAGDDCPTGGELIARLLEPLAALPSLAPNLRYHSRVVAVGRRGLLKHEEIASAARAARPFRLLVEVAGEVAGEALGGDGGGERWEEADAVLDCTGTWGQPNRLGDGGLPAPGEAALDGEVRRHPPDLAAERGAWAGRTILLAGAGHSAQTAAVELARLAAEAPGTKVVWVLRHGARWSVDETDPLPERGRLGREARALAAGASPAVEVVEGVVEALAPGDAGLRVTLRRAGGGFEERWCDRLLSLTGYVGDHGLYRQLQVHQCYATEGPMKLSAALLGAGAGADCLAAGAPGADTLVNPEPGFFILGVKSYGRNTTFLLRGGWQQVDDVFGLLAQGGLFQPPD